MLLSMVDVVFADVAQPDQARIVALNAHHFLKNGGHAVISIKASCIDSTAPAEAVFAAEVKKLQAESFKPREQLTLEPYERVRRTSLAFPEMLAACWSGKTGAGRDLIVLTLSFSNLAGPRHACRTFSVVPSRTDHPSDLNLSPHTGRVPAPQVKRHSRGCGR